MARILVLCGGDNGERRVSLAGGDAVARGLVLAGHQAVKLDTARPDRLVPHDQPVLDGPVGLTPPEELEKARLDRHGWLTLTRTLAEGHFDAVFPLLHGTWGEGGQIQALLELLGIPYLGSDMRSSAICLDKTRTLQVAQLLDIDIAQATLLRVPKDDPAAIDNALAVAVAMVDEDTWATYTHKSPHPVVIKPNFGGSTVGIYIGEDPEKLRAAIETILAMPDIPLLEEYVPGREVTVPIVGDTPLPMIEIHPHEGYYDYSNKYTKGRTDYLCPAPVPDSVQREAARQAQALYMELGCRHVARVDFRLTDRNELVLLEINTMPGMTDLSLVPMAAKKTGLDFPALMNRFVELVLG